MANFYVNFQGLLSRDDRGDPSDSARRIAAAGAPLLVAPVWEIHQYKGPYEQAERGRRNLTPQVLALLHDAGVRVYAYIASYWGDVPYPMIEAEINEALDAGCDGVYLEQANELSNEDKLNYYRELYKLVKSKGDKGVILNPGQARVGPRMREVTDYIMLGHQWRDVRTESPWLAGESARLMGETSDEDGGMGYYIDLERAVQDTVEAWRLGVGWHASLEKYETLPEWFETYVARVKEEAGAA